MSFLTATPSNNRLSSIDALRGIAACGVMFYHVSGGFSVTDDGMLPLNRGLSLLSAYGFTGVYLFFVISGFCIHLRWAKDTSATGTAHIDFFTFWRRRLWRLYPPYLVMLAASILMDRLMGKFTLTTFSLYDITMHALMLHNLDSRTVFSYSGVFWTLAIEEQLYMAYFALLWLRGRVSWKWILALTFGGRLFWYGLYLVLRHFEIQAPLEGGSLGHWFEWTLGMLAVEAFFGLAKIPEWTRKINIGLLLLVLAAVITTLRRGDNTPGPIRMLAGLFESPAWASAFFVVVNVLTRMERSWSRAAIPTVITAFAWVGVFSYSLYLTHELTVKVLELKGWEEVLKSHHLLFVVEPAVCLGFAWLFFQAVERHFIHKPMRILAVAPTATAV